MALNASTGGLCTTPECIRIASHMLWSMAPNYTEIDPCTDFDQYVCAGWDAHTQVPAGVNSIEVVVEQEQQITWDVSQMLEGPYPSGSDIGWVTESLSKEQAEVDKENWALLQKAYNSCMNMTATAALDVKPLQAFLEDLAKSFPTGSGSQKTDLDAFAKAVVKLQQFNIQTFFSATVNLDDLDKTKYVPVFGPPKFTDIPAGADEATLKLLTAYAAAMLQAVYPGNLTLDAATEKVTQMLKFQTTIDGMAKLGLASDPVSLDPTMLVPRASLEEINATAPALNFPAIFELMAPKGYKPENITLLGQDYMKNVSALIAGAPPAALKDYLIWRATLSLAEFTISDLTKPLNDYRATIKAQGLQYGEAAQWRTCVKNMESGPDLVNSLGPIGTPHTLGFAISRFFIDRYYSPEARKQTDEMATNIQETLGERMLQKDWVANKTKTAIKDKLDKIVHKIGFPESDPNVLDPASLRDYYAGLEFTDSYFANTLALAGFGVNKTWAQLGQPANPKAFVLATPMMVNAFYQANYNEINILTGWQQFPIYDKGFPSYLIYGGMGVVVAHEFIHGFDSQGRKFNADGEKADWWDNSTVAEFTKRTDCFVEQYEKFTITAPNGTELHVNGAKTLPENIADSGGVATSFEAWKRSMQKAKRGAASSGGDCQQQNPKLPGLEKFTDEQLFFIKWGQTWCDNRSPEFAVTALETDAHSPKNGRIKGSTANSAEFLKAFNCPNKKPTCELW